jgi:hypothetical protein
MNFCPRCKVPVTVTLTARGTERVHPHKCPHGLPCRKYEDTGCDACRAGRAFENLAPGVLLRAAAPLSSGE